MAFISYRRKQHVTAQGVWALSLIRTSIKLSVHMFWSSSTERTFDMCTPIALWTPVQEIAVNWWLLWWWGWQWWLMWWWEWQWSMWWWGWQWLMWWRGWQDLTWALDTDHHSPIHHAPNRIWEQQQVNTTSSHSLTGHHSLTWGSAVSTNSISTVLLNPCQYVLQ